MNWKIPLFKIYWDREDVKAVSKVIKSGRNWATGEYVDKFERGVAKYVSARYAISFNSGTSALQSLMIALGIGPGDEVIVPSFSFIATANVPLFVRAVPIFAEIESETYGLDPKDVEKKITKKTKAIMPVHYGGCACKIKELKKIARKHKLLLIEDAAESLGAQIGNKKVGSFGETAMFSFCAPKVITTGEGGVIVTNFKEIYEKLKLLRSHGRAESADYFSSAEYMDYLKLGYNFRMSNILASLGISQLKKLNKIIKLRKQKARYLSEKLSKIEEIRLPGFPKGYSHIYQIYTIYIKKGKGLRDALKEHLNKKGIMAKVYFPCIHLTKFYRKKFGCKKGDLPITEKISESVLTLPMYPDLKRKEIDFIVKEIKNFFYDKKIFKKD